jgi:type VI secretion system protein ImpE
MSQARSLFEAGRLAAAIEEVTREVKVRPTDPSPRTFLFELLCFAGEWDRAQKQLEVIGHQDAKTEIGIQVYRNNLAAERDRRRVFSGELQPHFLTEPPAYIDLHLAAIARLREGKPNEARGLLDRAEEERPAIAGTFNGTRFEDFRDWDDLVGPVLELNIRDQYTWLPYEQIARIEVNAPKQARDLVWARARIQATDGTIGEVYVPALYADSGGHASDQVRLGRATDWNRLSDELSVAVGLRQFLVDGEDKPIFEAQSIEFDPRSPQEPNRE